MDIKSTLSLERIDKNTVLDCVQMVCNNDDSLQELMKLLFKGDNKCMNNAAWVLSHCHDKNSEIFKPYLKKLILNLRSTKNTSVKRNTLRMLQDVEIPISLRGSLIDICFSFLKTSEPVGIKVFSLTVIENICKQENELWEELIIIIQDQLPFSSPAFISRASKILKRYYQRVK